MKSVSAIFAIILLLVGKQFGFSQSFVNLDFESANVSGFSPNSSDVPISSALPGWSGFYGSTPVSQVWYDGISLGGTIISVVDNKVSDSSFDPIQGVYSAYLFGGSSIAATISQTGLVPIGTKSLQVEIQSQGTPFDVALGGQALHMIPLQTSSAFTLYGANIPNSFAGSSETLSFTSPIPAGVPPNFLELDDIAFSPNSVPEPATWALIMCGMAVFTLRSLCTRQR
jgi:hypothetical protein